MYTHTPVTPLGMVSLDTVDGRHYQTPSGHTYPSITTVLGDGEKMWLEEWRQSLGKDQADAEMLRASNRGSDVHLIVERHLQNHPDPTHDILLPDHISLYKSMRFLLKGIDNILLQEGALYSDTLRVAGRVDCIACFDGRLSVVDFKTSTAPKNAAMVEDYFLQTTAYAVMFNEIYDIVIEDLVIIMGVERGVPQLFKRSVEPYIRPLCERINKYHATNHLNNKI